jgi:hypothetical protein
LKDCQSNQMLGNTQGHWVLSGIPIWIISGWLLLIQHRSPMTASPNVL